MKLRWAMMSNMFL